MTTIEVQRADERFLTDAGWLHSRHSFNFGSHYSPLHERHGLLLVNNDDVVAPGQGFGTHGHRDMEIVTYVRSGAVSHRDSLGNEGRTEAGDVQVMSAGKGIVHSEFNLEDEETSLFQIWIHPESAGGEPSWGTRPFPKADRSGRFVTLASGFPGDGDALPIRTPARVLGATLRKGETVRYELGAGRHAYCVPAAGAFDIDGIRIDARDGVAISEVDGFTVTAVEDCELVLVDAL